MILPRFAVLASGSHVGVAPGGAETNDGQASLHGYLPDACHEPTLRKLLRADGIDVGSPRSLAPQQHFPATLTDGVTPILAGVDDTFRLLACRASSAASVSRNDRTPHDARSSCISGPDELRLPSICHSSGRSIASTPPRIASVCASIAPTKCHVRRVSRLASSARSASGVTCPAACRLASVIASACSTERPAPVKRRAIA